MRRNTSQSYSATGELAGRSAGHPSKAGGAPETSQWSTHKREDTEVDKGGENGNAPRTFHHAGLLPLPLPPPTPVPSVPSVPASEPEALRTSDASHKLYDAQSSLPLPDAGSTRAPPSYKPPSSPALSGSVPHSNSNRSPPPPYAFHSSGDSMYGNDVGQQHSLMTGTNNTSADNISSMGRYQPSQRGGYVGGRYERKKEERREWQPERNARDDTYNRYRTRSRERDDKRETTAYSSGSKRNRSRRSSSSQRSRTLRGRSRDKYQRSEYDRRGKESTYNRDNDVRKSYSTSSSNKRSYGSYNRRRSTSRERTSTPTADSKQHAPSLSSSSLHYRHDRSREKRRSPDSRDSSTHRSFARHEEKSVAEVPPPLVHTGGSVEGGERVQGGEEHLNIEGRSVIEPPVMSDLCSIKVVFGTLLEQLFDERCTQKSMSVFITMFRAVCVEPLSIVRVMEVIEERLASIVASAGERAHQLILTWYVVDGILKCLQEEVHLRDAVVLTLPHLLRHYVPWPASRLSESAWSDAKEELPKFTSMFSTWTGLIPEEFQQEILLLQSGESQLDTQE